MDDMDATAGDPAMQTDEIVAGEGAVVVSADEPDDLALRLVEALDAELLDSPDELDDAIQARLRTVEDRTRALAALELEARMRAGLDHRHTVADLRSLRRLVGRIEQAAELVDASRSVLRERVGSGTGVALHPEALRPAAADVVAARAAVAAVEEEIAIVQRRLDAGPRESDMRLLAADHEFVEPGWGDDERRGLVRAGLAAIAGLVVGVGALVLTGSVIALVIPVVALAWSGVLVAKHRTDTADLDVASDNLAAVAALTDQAYGGSVEQAFSPELDDARTRLAEAEQRLRYAEGVWVGLVGSGVEVESVDELIRARDPNLDLQLDEGELAQTPTVRAAEAHVRRLTAQWKVAWYALDRPIPSLDEAVGAIDSLEAEGIDEITVPTHEARTASDGDDEERFAELAGGRSIDELRADATRPPRPLVVVDPDGAIGEADLAARTAVLPSDARIVVVTGGSTD